MILVIFSILCYLASLFSLFYFPTHVNIILSSTSCLLLFIAYVSERVKREDKLDDNLPSFFETSSEDNEDSSNDEENEEVSEDDSSKETIPIIEITNEVKEEEEKEQMEKSIEAPDLLEKSEENDAFFDDTNSQALSALIPCVVDKETSEELNIVEVCELACNELRKAASLKDITLQVAPSSPNISYFANKENIKILFRNIIDNSIKYMFRAGILTLTLSKVEDTIFIACKDNGMGLAPDETEHVFELNYQGSNRVSGNGLGLAQAKAIVDAYNGKISARSNKEKGMGIYIELPVEGR